MHGVGCAGCMNLVHPLCVCGCVRLMYNYIRNEGCAALAAALVHVPSLRTLEYVWCVRVEGMWGVSGECERGRRSGRCRGVGQSAECTRVRQVCEWGFVRGDWGDVCDVWET